MKGYAMNYLQSFKPNGLVNANGRITIASIVSTDDFNIYKYNFINREWELCIKEHSFAIDLDYNGVCNDLYQLEQSGATGRLNIDVRDYDGNSLSRSEINLADYEWNDTEYKEAINEFNEEFAKINEKQSSMNKIKASDAAKRIGSEMVIDLNSLAITNAYCMILNNLNEIVNVNNMELNPKEMLVGWLDENKQLRLI